MLKKHDDYLQRSKSCSMFVAGNKAPGLDGKFNKDIKLSVKSRPDMFVMPDGEKLMLWLKIDKFPDEKLTYRFSGFLIDIEILRPTI